MFRNSKNNELSANESLNLAFEADLAKRMSKRNGNIFLSTAPKGSKEELFKQLGVSVNAVRELCTEGKFTQLTESYCEKIKQIVGSGLGVNLKCDYGYTPILAATFAGNLELIEFLVKADADMQAVTSHNQTSLHLSANNADPFVMLSAMRDKGQLNKRDRNNNTALNYMLLDQNFYRPIIEIMFIDGVDDKSIKDSYAISDTINNTKATAVLDIFTDSTKKKRDDSEIRKTLLKAVHLGEIRRSKENLTDTESSLMDEFESKNIDSALNLVGVDDAMGKNLVLAYILAMSHCLMELKDPQYEKKSELAGLMDMSLGVIKLGADVDINSSEGKFSVLHLASYLNSLKTVKDLFKNPSFNNSHKVTSDGSSSLHLNVSNKEAKIFDIILSRDPDLLDLQRNDGNTALHIAAENGFAGLVKNLVEKGADRKLVNKDGHTALHLATICANEKDFIKVVKNLLSKSSVAGFINLVNQKDGNNALHYAAKSGSALAVKSLLDSGCDAMMTNNDGETAAQCASGKHVRKLLIEAEKLQISSKTNIVAISTDDKNSISSIAESPQEFDKMKLESDYAQLLPIKSSSKERKKDKVVKPSDDGQILNQNNDLQVEITKEKFEKKNELSDGDKERLALDEIAKKKREDRERARNPIVQENSIVRSEEFDTVTQLSKSEIKKLKRDAVKAAKPLLRVSREEFSSEDRLSQMKDFLSHRKGDRVMESILDLPPFLQLPIANILKNGHMVLVKGSAVNKSQKVPADLDVEVTFQCLASKEDKKVKEFISDNFGLELSDTDIYRGRNYDFSDFTANIKGYEGLLNIILCDSSSSSSLSWLDSKEKKYVLNLDGIAQEEKSNGLHNHQNTGIDLTHLDIIFNRDAKHLIQIVAFRESIGNLTKDDVADGLWPSIYPANPIDLFFKEMRMDRARFTKSESKSEVIKSGVNKFIDSHSLYEGHRLLFLANLSKIILDVRNPGVKTDQSYYPMLLDVIKEMRDEASHLASSSPTGTSSKTSMGLSHKDNSQIIR